MKTKKMKASDCYNTKNTKTSCKKSGSSKCSSNQKNID